MNETPDCERARPLLAELATGTATGHERAWALGHVARCIACRQELMDLARVADDLLLLAPRREPPPGFESAVVARIADATEAVTPASPRDAIGPPRRSRVWPRVGVRLVAAAIVVVLAAVGGAAVAYWHGASDRRLAAQYEQTIGAAGGQYPRAVKVTTANGSVVGHVFFYTGAPAWATVALRDVPQSGDYAMSVLATDGKRYPEGVCTVTAGNGIASYPLPVTVAEIAAIELTRPGIALTVTP